MLEYTGKYGTAKVMLDTFDDDQAQVTISQIYKFLNHPAFTNPIAIMPDCHKGKGVVIGFTMKLTDKVIPNVIGVDIGCFTGNTKIPLLNGLEYNLIDLLDKEYFYIYSMDENLQIVPGKAKCLKTRENTELIEVVISGGKTIKCTPDQGFMLTNGTYKEAKDLVPKKDSLMPLYRSYQTRDGYETVYSVHSKAQNTHKMVTNYLLEECPKDHLTHHKNEKWYDNDPENLEYIHKNIHSSLHASKRQTFISEEFKEKKKKTIEERGYYYDPKYREKKKKVATKNIKTYMEENREEWLEKIKDNGKRGKKFLEKLNNNYTCEICGKTCGNLGAYGRHKKSHNLTSNNHKVLFVRKLDKKEDVFCLKVEKHHNFALSAGVFVHNCGMVSMDMGKDLLDKILPNELDSKIREKIPFSKNVHNNKSSLPKDFYKDSTLLVHKFQQKFNKEFKTSYTTPSRIDENWMIGKCQEINMDYGRVINSMGTLGSGNHFLEVGIGLNDNFWVTIHSGSRQFGLKIANYHQRKVGKGHLAYLEGNDMFDYLIDMVVAQSYAHYNRIAMASSIAKIVGVPPVINMESVHNYIDFEDFIIRKGAISAYEHDNMIIPFNMEDGILLCKGKSNKEWNYSAPHGSGRVDSRTWAKANLNLDEAKQRMTEKGIYCSTMPIDETKQAYKDPKLIEDTIKPTAEIIDRLKPVLSCKG